MKKVFISHPYAGNPKENIEKATRICQYALRQGYLPISPLHAFTYIEKETIRLRKEILSACYLLISICDEVWVFGQSDGCRREEKMANEMGKKVELFYEDIDYKELMEEPYGRI